MYICFSRQANDEEDADGTEQELTEEDGATDETDSPPVRALTRAEILQELRHGASVIQTANGLSTGSEKQSSFTNVSALD